MAVEDEIRKLQEDSLRETRAFVARFRERQHSLLEEFKRAGVTIEYVRESDHLYITFGDVRDSVAIFVGHIVVCVDPDDEDDICGIDIPMFSVAMKTKAFAGLWWVMPILRLVPKMGIPPQRRDAPKVLAWRVHSMMMEMASRRVIGSLQRAIASA